MTNRQRVSMGRPDETLARKLGMLGFGAASAVIGIPLVLLVIESWGEIDEITAAGFVLFGGAWALFTFIFAWLFLGRPKKVIIDYGEGTIQTNERELSLEQIRGVRLKVETSLSGPSHRRRVLAYWVALVLDEQGKSYRMGRALDVTTLYLEVHRVGEATGCPPAIDGATYVRDQDKLSRRSGEAERSWFFWSSGEDLERWFQRLPHLGRHRIRGEGGELVHEHRFKGKRMPASAVYAVVYPRVANYPVAILGDGISELLPTKPAHAPALSKELMDIIVEQQRGVGIENFQWGGYSPQSTGTTGTR